MMNRCKECLLPDTAPKVVFEDGVCLACTNYKKRKDINWGERHNELKNICDKYRGNGFYDCVVPVSGGKDSHFIVHKIKNEMGMNPLLVTVGDPFTSTRAGLSNFNNLSETFNCDQLLFNISSDVFRRATRAAFEQLGEPLKFVELAIYIMPYNIASNLGIPIVIFGENSAYEYGYVYENSKSLDVDKMMKSVDYDFWARNGIKEEEMNSIRPPTCRSCDPQVLFMSYFYPWSSRTNLDVARRYGFVDLSNEWNRLGYVEHFEQIDSIAYLFHLWMKYPKFGFQRTTDIVSRRIREGFINKEEGLELIRDNDHNLDPESVRDFLDFTKYTRKEFLAILNKWWNENIFVRMDNDIWKLKQEL